MCQNHAKTPSSGCRRIVTVVIGQVIGIPYVNPQINRGISRSSLHSVRIGTKRWKLPFRKIDPGSWPATI
jgi:hypothetical protein